MGSAVVLCELYVRRLKALGAFFDGELYLLTFLQIFETFRLDCAIVDKDVGFTRALDKTISFACVEPLDGAGDSIAHFPYSWCEEKKE
jgi:hypothetical protein